MKLHLFPKPVTDNQFNLEMAYQLGISEGRAAGRSEGIAIAEARMRNAQTGVLSAMGIREELGA